jgi:serine/threonine protein kinase
MIAKPRDKEALFADALALPPERRREFLAAACGAESALHAELVALIAAHEDPDSVFGGAQTQLTAHLPDERAGDWIGRYRLLQQIGEGGCGVVWMAEQEEPVRRRVALKVIKLGMDTKAVIARFEAERQALAMMDHPHIAKVHDAGSTDNGRPFFVMELVRGIAITKYCDESQLTPAARLELFIKVCQAVQHAHQKGIIHRDLKPSNILVTVNDGQPTPKIIDFGIAKATQGRLTDATLFTAFEQFIGTPAYMSPEQAEMSSLDIDTRSDIYSLGVLLYELLTGRPPFDPKRFVRASVEHIRQQIRESEPPRPSARWRTLAEADRTTVARQRGTLPAQIAGLLRGDLDWIVMRCLEKDRTRRYETANGLAMDIQRHLRNEPVVARPPSTAYLLQKLFRRHRFGFAAAGAVLGVIVIGAVVVAAQARRALRAERAQAELRESARQEQLKAATARLAAEEEKQRQAKQRWAREHVLPEITRLLDAGDIFAAFAAALEAEKLLPDDPALLALWPKISVMIPVETTPEGADIYVKPYLKPTADWQHLGKSPLAQVRLARDAYRWQVRKDGYSTLERAGLPSQVRHFSLDRADDVPPGMVRISRQLTIAQSRAGTVSKDPLGSFFIDRHEVTNRQFKEFVDRGGYVTPGFWKQPFSREGKKLAWAEALAGLQDASGQPGPATWKNGTYPTGEDDYPVTGVSWFEAAAYAESVGKRLPSIHHWRRAANPMLAADGVPLLSLSNFSVTHLARVGLYAGMSWCGVYDLAGNAKEWCWNEATPGRRYILGGAMDEPVYQFADPDAQSPFSRLRTNGFRCVKLVAGNESTESFDRPEPPVVQDFNKDDSVSDDVFRIYRSQFTYDKTPLDVRIESSETGEDRPRMERISFNAAYGDERVSVVVVLPKMSVAPYQTVIFVPPSPAFSQRSLDESVWNGPMAKIIVESGRAWVFPVFKGTYDRGEGRMPEYAKVPSRYRDDLVYWSKDLGRTIDYLETRPDIRGNSLAYLGFSFGAMVGSVLPAVEDRLNTLVLVNGGMTRFQSPPEVSQVNFAPRIKIPTLMINGRYDFTFTEPSQRQFFRLLGTPNEHKRLLYFDVGHSQRVDLYAKDILAWLDRYLGPVR